MFLDEVTIPRLKQIGSSKRCCKFFIVIFFYRKVIDRPTTTSYNNLGSVPVPIFEKQACVSDGCIQVGCSRNCEITGVGITPYWLSISIHKQISWFSTIYAFGLPYIF